MTEDAPKPSRFGGLRGRLLSILAGLVVTLIVGAIAERVTSAEWLADAKQAQQGWVDAVAATSPLRVGELYWTELDSAFTGDISRGGYSGHGASEGRGMQSPFWALAITGARLWDAAGVVALVQIGLGVLAYFVLNLAGQKVSRSRLGWRGSISCWGRL